MIKNEASSTQIHDQKQVSLFKDDDQGICEFSFSHPSTNFLIEK